MKVRAPVPWSLVIAIAVAAFPAAASIQQPADPAAQPQAPAPNTTQTTTLPAQSQQPQGSAPLRVMVGKSLLIKHHRTAAAYLDYDPAIAFAQVITPTQIWFMARLRGKYRYSLEPELEALRAASILRVVM